MSLLREWLLFRFVFLRDPRAFHRLKALCRLETGRELKQIKELVQDAEALGVDPELIVNAYVREKVWQIEKALLCLPLLLLLVGCEKPYHCIGYRDRLIENRPGEAGPPLCETPDGQVYDAQQGSAP